MNDMSKVVNTNFFSDPLMMVLIIAIVIGYFVVQHLMKRGRRWK